MAESGSNEQGDGHDNRRLRTLQGVFNFCLAQTKKEDAPEGSAAREMSPERKEWLKKAWEGMMGDPVKQMMDNIVNVGKFVGSDNPTEDLRQTALDSLENLTDWCECIDMANDFLKVGGFSILNEVMSHSDNEIRGHSFRLISALVQNNPTCQEAAIQDDLIPRMLAVLSTETDPTVHFQAVQAISCLVRDGHTEGAREQFLASNGFGVFKNILQCPGSFKRVAKIAFFVTVMCDGSPAYKDLACDHGLVELLVSEVKGEHQHAHEQVMSALLALAKGHHPTQNILTKKVLGFVPFLEDRIAFLTGKEEFLEEREAAEELLKILKLASSST